MIADITRRGALPRRFLETLDDERLETMEKVSCDCCGAACIPTGCTTGYGKTPDGRRLCFPCCDQWQRLDFSAADKFSAYVSGDGKAVTTWTGGKLAIVAGMSRHRGGFGGEYFTVQAVAPNGARWYGRGGGAGMYVNLRRAKS
jgi:hypothetical protein